MKSHPDWKLYEALSRAECIQDLFDTVHNYFGVYSRNRQLLEASWMADLRQHLREDKQFKNWAEYLPQTRITLINHMHDVGELTTEAPHNPDLFIEKCVEACHRIYDNWRRRDFKAKLRGGEEPIRTL